MCQVLFCWESGNWRSLSLPQTTVGAMRTSSLALCSRQRRAVPRNIPLHIWFFFFFWLLPRWKDNPAMPEGLVYEGVATEPLRYSGGSAAQSSVLQAFDEFLGIRHCKGSGKQQPGLMYSLKGRIRKNGEAFLPTYKTRSKEQRTEVYPCLNHQTVVPMLVNIGASDFSRILGSFPSLNTKSWNGEHLGWSLSCGLWSLVCKLKG